MSDGFQSSAVHSLMPEILLDVDKTLLKWRQTSTEKVNEKIDLLEKYALKCNHLNHQISNQKKVANERCKKLQIDIEEMKDEVRSKQNQEQCLKEQISSLIKLAKQDPISFSDDNKLIELRQKVHTLEEEKERIKKAIVHDIKQFQNGIFFYKKYLHCNVIITPEKNVIFTFNTSAKNELQAREFIKFNVNSNGEIFQYVEMNPNTDTEKRSLKRFKETGDIQGFILSFWKTLKMVKRKQHISGRS